VYTHTYTSVNGCDSVVTARITITDAVASEFTAAACKSYRLPWDSTVTTSGVYTHTYTSVNGCDSVVTARITISDLKVVANAPDIACGQSTGNITVTASGGVAPYQYSLDGVTYQSSNVFSALPAGSYTVHVKDATGCTGQTNVSFSPTPNATISGGTTICAGAGTTLDITLIGTAPFTVVYSDGTGTHTISGITASPYKLTVAPNSTTTYTLISVTDAKCTNSNLITAATVTVLPSGTGIRYPTIRTQVNTTTQLEARDFGSGTSYLWNPPTGLNFSSVRTPIFKYDRDVEYTIRITSPNGCIVVDTLLVVVPETSPITIKSDIFVPKAWSPNKDGHNDKLYPLTINIRELRYFRVFNRWGQLLFETNQIGAGWDGVHRGQAQVMDVYTWTLEAVGEDGVHYKRAGNSVLLR
jgi:gliding motility-associated-like protein